MSADENGEEIPGREIAYRLFAAEYDDASLSYAESDEERAPNYVITPTGARLNRLFVAGTLTEVTAVNDEMLRARVVDPTGAFVVYAGQYQPDELAFLEQIEPPAFVAVTGKARTFQPEDSDRVYTSIRPESIATIDADTRDRWVVSAAEQTLERVGTYAGAAALEGDGNGDALAETLRESGVESGLADGIPLARDHYGTTPSYLAALRDCALEAVEVVAGDRDQVGGLQLDPAETGPEYETTFDALADLAALEPVESEGGNGEDAAPEEPLAATVGTSEGPSEASDATADSLEASATDEPGTEIDAEAEVDAEPGSDFETEPTALETDASESADTVGNPATETTEANSLDEPTAASAGSDETEAGDSDFDFDTDSDVTAASDEDIDEYGGGMYEMDDSEREQLEAEFGAEFTTGTEIEDPGEADIDVSQAETDLEVETDGESGVEPEPESDADANADADGLGAAPASNLESDSVESDPDAATEAEPEVETDEPVADEASESVDADADADADTDETTATADTDESEDMDDVDLQAYVVETMQELDDGDGTDRSELVETVAADTGATEADVETAIEDALMGGQCYEPDDETLKAI